MASNPRILFVGPKTEIIGVVASRMYHSSKTDFTVCTVRDLDGQYHKLHGRIGDVRVGEGLRVTGMRLGRDTQRAHELGYHTTFDSRRFGFDPEALATQRAISSHAAAKLRALEMLSLDKEHFRRYMLEHCPGMTDARYSEVMRRLGNPSTGTEAANAMDKVDAPVLQRGENNLGLAAANAIAEFWASDSSRHRAHIALEGLGLSHWQASTALAKAMAAPEGDLPPPPEVAAARILQHPYRLSLIQGINFRTVDRMAAKLGVDGAAPARMAAAAREAMLLAERRGDTAQPLFRLCQSALNIITNQSGGPVATSDIQFEDIAGHIYKAADNEGLCFPAGRDSGAQSLVSFKQTAVQEREIAEMIVQKAAEILPGAIEIPSPEKMSAIAGFDLHESQLDACRLLLQHPFAILTGGPGTGKTSIVTVAETIMQQHGLSVLQAAPTGMAAARLSDVTGRAATTAHQMLGSKSYTEFARGPDSPIEADVILLDEASMNDTPLSHAVWRAIATGTRVIWVGDEDQLPSVGPGSVLSNLISSGVVPVARLTRPFRFSGPIAELAHNLRDGVASLPEQIDDSVLAMIHCAPDKIVSETLKRVIDIRNSGAEPSSIMVLTPRNEGNASVEQLNSELQKALNPEGLHNGVRVGHEGKSCAGPGDRVMFLANDKRLGLANGDVGTVAEVSADRSGIVVMFGKRRIELAGRHLTKVQLSYACTIHKSQGSESSHVLMMLNPEHQAMMSRNLVYTGVTRAKGQLHLIGDMDVLLTAANNVAPSIRCTLLNWHIQRIVMNGVPNLVPWEDQIVQPERPLKLTHASAPSG